MTSFHIIRTQNYTQLNTQRLVVGDHVVKGDINVSGTLTVLGSETIEENLTVSGNATITGQLQGGAYKYPTDTTTISGTGVVSISEDQSGTIFIVQSLGSVTIPNVTLPSAATSGLQYTFIAGVVSAGGSNGQNILTAGVEQIDILNLGANTSKPISNTVGFVIGDIAAHGVTAAASVGDYVTIISDGTQWWGRAQTVNALVIESS